MATKTYKLTKESQKGLSKKVKLTTTQARMLKKADRLRREHAKKARQHKKTVDAIIGSLKLGKPKQNTKQVNLVDGKQTVALVKPVHRQGYECDSTTYWGRSVTQQ